MRSTLLSHEVVFEQVRPYLSPEGKAWLKQVRSDVRNNLRSVRLYFPSVGRHCGRAPLEDVPEEMRNWTVDDAVRVVILSKLRSLWQLSGFAPANYLVDVEELYRSGDAAEKRAVLYSLPYLFEGDEAVPLLQDALRTNDTRLVRAALGPYARDQLPAHDYRQAILKCIFVGVPLDEIWGLPERADDELATMMAAYAQERVAAGRAIPNDVWLVLSRYPHVITESGLTDYEPRLSQQAATEPGTR